MPNNAYTCFFDRQFIDARQRYIEDCYANLSPEDKATIDAVTKKLVGELRNFGEVSAHELIFQVLSWRKRNEN